MSDDIKPTNRLREMRDEADVTAEHLAYVLGVAVKTLYNWEHAPKVKAHQLYAYEAGIARVVADRASWEGAVSHRFPTLDQPALFDLAA